ncbi:MAG: undecaprenyldiphospho-muramoylpentapeptide beta-N-acetylglucosaminyltransferase [Gammaproteobacteria bacterium]|nr:undecaprenyldiphospho-muramoylpentapeptide beta-N-acetylglucosaminyltransferase [Gammaproteobacteria bacterium]
MIFAAGTGGHVFPALAVARKLEQQGVPVVWVGTKKGIESRVVANTAYRFEEISIGGLRNKDLLTYLLAPVKLGLAGLQTIRLVLKHRPCAVLGMGGFVSGTGGLAAALFRRPLVIHEQNAISGLTNRLLAPFATHILAAFPGTFARKNVEVVGNPVRKEISRDKREHEVGDPEDRPLHVLVVGGSLGAHTLNKTVPDAVALLEAGKRPQVWHQSGDNKLEFTQQAYDSHRIEARVDAFIENMHDAYAWADLVICRAGAITVAELAIAGVGAVFVPYPYAVDDHQTANASVLVKAGAAFMIQERELNASGLAALLRDVEVHRSKVRDLAAAIRGFAKPRAAEDVAKICMQACLKRKGEHTGLAEDPGS